MKDFFAVVLAIVMVIGALWVAWTIEGWRASFRLQPQVDQLKLSNNAMERIASSLETIASNIHRIDRQGSGDVVKLPDMQGEIGRLQIVPALNGTTSPYILQGEMK